MSRQVVEVITLFRPVWQAELDLREASSWRDFPPRLPFQPSFYPAVQLECARQIARDWNTKDAACGFVGYVTAFDIDSAFLDRYEIQTVGSDAHREHWIPAAELVEFNSAIADRVRLLRPLPHPRRLSRWRRLCRYMRACS